MPDRTAPWPRLRLLAFLPVLMVPHAPAGEAAAQTSPVNYDVVIRGGRVMDPESGLDAVRNVGIQSGKIVTLSTEPLAGRDVIDAAGLVVAPGFIDLDAYPENAVHRLLDGVTSILDLRRGTADVARWYDEWNGKMPVHYGTGVNYARIRRVVMGERGRLDLESRHDASRDELAEILRRVELGLNDGAVAVSMGASEWQAPPHFELLEVFRVAAQARAHVVATIRDAIWARTDVPALLAELMGAAAITRASMHVPHITSSGGPHVPVMLRMIDRAREHGLDVTAEEYPYTAAIIRIPPGGLDRVSDEDLGEAYWLDSGERVTRANAALRERDALAVVMNASIEPYVAQALAHPAVSVASHGYLDPQGKGHPRTSGSNSRVLARYVREQKVLTLMQALRAASLLPAQRVEARVPAMRHKGRIRVGADADIVIFDPLRIADRATYQEPALPPEGIRHVLVGGHVVVRAGRIEQGILPGRPLRHGNGGG